MLAGSEATGFINALARDLNAWGYEETTGLLWAQIDRDRSGKISLLEVNRYLARYYR